MKIDVNKDGNIRLQEVFSGVLLETSDGEFLGVCMRDSGFEVNYNGRWYSMKEGLVVEMGGREGHSEKDAACNPA
jgi:hypothetical protein